MLGQSRLSRRSKRCPSKRAKEHSEGLASSPNRLGKDTQIWRVRGGVAWGIVIVPRAKWTLPEPPLTAQNGRKT